MWVFSFDDGMRAASWYAEFALRNRVSMSAIGSVIVMGVVPLSPRFHTPCAWASRRSVVHGCWAVLLPGRLAHAGQLARVRHLPQADAAQAELPEDRVGAAAPLAAGVA